MDEQENHRTRWIGKEASSGAERSEAQEGSAGGLSNLL